MLTKELLIILSYFLLSNIARAQTWIAGSALSDQPGTYNNSLGPMNTIGARSNAAYWVEGDNTWIFGGMGYGNDTMFMEAGLLSDYWKFNGTWSYVNGSKSTGTAGQYNLTLGAVYPGGRSHAIYWKAYGLLWIYGGMGFNGFLEEGALNDIWAFNPSNGLWTFKGGSEQIDAPPQYNATRPVPPLNISIPANPGSRDGASSWLVRGKNGVDTLWVYGGTHDEEFYHTDMWTYDMTSNIWAWVAGSNLSVIEPEGPTPAPTVPSVSPSPRTYGASWVGPDGALYLFGGFHLNETSEAILLLNDIWKFNTATLQWTLVQPTTLSGVYNHTLNDRPAPRYSPAFTSDKFGNLYLFGGSAPLFEEGTETMNDLWIYYTASNQWKWVLGSPTPNSPGVYNTTTRKGVPSSRASAALWIDSVERLWLFGGSNSTEEGGMGSRNDLWVLIDDVDPTPPTTTGPATSSGQTVTTGQPNVTTSGHQTSTTGQRNGTTSGQQTLTSGSSTGYNTTSGGSLTSGGFTTSHTNSTTGNNNHHPVNTGLIVGSVMGGGITIGASVIGILLYRGNLRFRNLFRRGDAEDYELLPLNRRR